MHGPSQRGRMHAGMHSCQRGRTKIGLRPSYNRHRDNRHDGWSHNCNGQRIFLKGEHASS